MHLNRIWIAFFSTIVLLTLWFGGKGMLALFSYYHLSEKVPVTVEKIELKELKKNRYVLHAFFAFDFHGEKWKGESSFGPIFPNPYAAEKTKTSAEKKSYFAYFPRNQPQKAVLEKAFPYKKVLSASVLLLLTFYFLFLGCYVGKLKL